MTTRHYVNSQNALISFEDFDFWPKIFLISNMYLLPLKSITITGRKVKPCLIFVSKFAGPTSPTRCPCFPKEKSFVADSKFSAYNFCDKSCSSWSLKNCDKNHFDGKKQNLILIVDLFDMLKIWCNIFQEKYIIYQEIGTQFCLKFCPVFTCTIYITIHWMKIRILLQKCFMARYGITYI